MLAITPAVFRSPFLRQGPSPRPLYIGTYPPRECGIATFTEDVKLAVDERTVEPADVIAINDAGKDYGYPPAVIGAISRDDLMSYVRAARAINAHPADVLNIQHEYGLFGGDHGSMLIELMARVRKPIVTTLHTILPNPDASLRYVTRELCNRSDIVIVLAYAGRRLLEEDYGIDSRKVQVVLHGAPDVPLRSSRHFKRRFGLEGKTVLSTFGLLSPNKGIEHLIDALPAVFERHPDAVYLLLGETHPAIRSHNGEAYRESLLTRAEQLGILDRIQFKNRYMSDEEVVSYLLATDVYVSPTLDPNQIVSGTLSYAVACGRVVIATATTYAKELLADGRGTVVPFHDAGALAGGVNAVLDDPQARQSMEINAYRFGRRMVWPRVAREFDAAFCDAIRLAESRAAQVLSAPRHLVIPTLRAAQPAALVEAAE